MEDAKKIGRIVGVLFLLKLFGGPVQNFTLMIPVLAKPDGFLVNAAAHPLNLPLATMIAFAIALLSLATAVVAYPLFRKHAPSLALAFLALTIVGISTTLVETMTMMSMLSLSQAYVAAVQPDPALYEALRVVVGKARNWAHYTNMLVGGATLLVMFALLYRTRLIPRAIAGFGMLCSLLQLSSIGRPYFGLEVDFRLLAPLGLAFVLLIGWLLWRGFEEPKPAA